MKTCLWLVVVAVMFLATIIDARLSTSSSCATTSNLNVSSGTPSAASKFVVTAADCCAYCTSLENHICVAAVFHSYYCHPFSEVTATSVDSGSELISLSTTTLPPPTPAPTTTTTTAAPTPAPTPAPPTPAPTPVPPAFTPVPWTPNTNTPLAFLTTCPNSLECSNGLYACTSLVLLFDACSWDSQSGKYHLATNSTDGVLLRTTETMEECKQAQQQQRSGGSSVGNNNHEGTTTMAATSNVVLFPWICQYMESSGNAIVAFVESVDFEGQLAKYNVGMVEYDDNVCDMNGQTIFSGSSGQCMDNISSSASSSASSSGSDGGCIAFCVGLDPTALVVFSYPTMSACYERQPVAGFAGPAGTCYNPGSYNYFYNTCESVGNQRTGTSVQKNDKKD